MIFTLIAGISYPGIAAYSCGIFFAGRIMQLIGPNKYAGTQSVMSIFKVIGFWTGSICQFILIWYSFKTCIYLGVDMTKDVGALKFDVASGDGGPSQEVID